MVVEEEEHCGVAENRVAERGAPGAGGGREEAVEIAGEGDVPEEQLGGGIKECWYWNQRQGVKEGCEVSDEWR